MRAAVASPAVHIELDDTLSEGDRSAFDTATLASCVSLASQLLLEGGRPDGVVTVLLAGDALLQALNREHRGRDEPTDVLAFAADEGEPFPGPADEDDELGDIVIGVPVLLRQAHEAGISADDELRHVVVHGVLHLLGHDHEDAAEAAEMVSREEALLGAEIHAGGADHEH